MARFRRCRNPITRLWMDSSLSSSNIQWVKLSSFSLTNWSNWVTGLNLLGMMSRFRNTRMGGLAAKLDACTAATFIDGSKTMSRPMTRKHSISARKCSRRTSSWALIRDSNSPPSTCSRCTWTETISLTICSEDGKILSEVLWKFLLI